MFDGASNIQLGGELLKINYPKLTVMHRVENTVSLFFNNFSKIPILNQIITSHKAMYDLFGSVIYQKPHYILKPEYYESQNRKIGLLNGNDTRMDVYLFGTNTDLDIKKSPLSTVSSS